MKTKNTKKIILIVLVAVFLASWALSRSSGPVAAAPAMQTDPDEETDETETNEAQTQTGEEQIVEAQSLLNVVQNRDELDDFEMLIAAAGLADNLEKDGPFTIFAPTDAALATFGTLAADSEASVTEILLYHIINGLYDSPDLVNFSTMPTLLGEHVSIGVEGGQIMLNDTVKITTTDIPAENGIIHVVDAVLLPPVNSLITTDSGSRGHTLDEVLADDGRFTTFLSLAETAGLNDELADLGQTYTVFAPTDTAFEKLSEAQMNDVMADPETFVSYLLVNDMLGINQIATDDYIPTLLARRPLMVSTDESLQVFLNGQPLTEFNMIAANGVIHVVDTVLMP
jgi:uncharacterized surface protein with fasciclin (FAS1) repeats